MNGKKTPHVKRETPNAERQTPDLEWKRSPLRVKEGNQVPRLVPCLAEVEELIRIFVASVRTAEKRNA